MIALDIEARDQGLKARDIRTSGKIPAVFYGKKQSATSVTVKHTDFLRVWKQVGSSSVVTLKGADAEFDALIHDVQINPVTDTVEHADFYVFEKGQKIEVHTPIEFTGNAPIVKAGGVLVKVIHELHIEAAPKDLPHSIEVDISPLETFESVILAKDIKLPPGVELKTGPEEVVASVYEPKEEVEEAPVAFDPDAIEVEKKGKEAKEGEEGEAPAAEEGK